MPDNKHSDSPTKKVKNLTYQFAQRHGVLVQTTNTTPITVICREDVQLAAILEVRRFFACTIALKTISQQGFEKLLVEHYETQSKAAMQMAEAFEENLNLQDMAREIQQKHDLLASSDDAPIIRLINALLNEAIKEKASDIHIEVFENSLNVRFRIDGVLRTVLAPQRNLAPFLISRIKVMARLDISEKRLPQDGRIGVSVSGRQIDVRVSTMPSSHGERVVLRILDKQVGTLRLPQLGMAADDLASMENFIVKPHGILLITGPTGSGKTTTLYAALSALDHATRNILTIEDPIEFDLPGIGQTQVNNKIHMTFAKGLRAILRQDPDVVMIGEIRDIETAKIAVQASLTGHLVLSTLHTNTAIGAVTRLIDMGVERFLISSSLVGIVAQRLIRLLCPHCKKAVSPSHIEYQQLGMSPSEPITLYEAVGCDACNHIGFKRRSGIYEVIPVDDNLRAMIHDGVGEIAQEKSIRRTHQSMRDDGLRRVLAGDTTLKEVLRVTAEGVS